MSAQSYTSITPKSAAGHSLAASPCSEISCGCCGRKPAKFRGEQMTSIGWVPITTCRWCEASATRFRNSQNPQDASPLRGWVHPTVQKYSLRKTIMKTTQNIIKLEPKTYGVGVFFSFRDVVEYSKENVYTWSMPRKYLYVLVALVFFSLSFQFPISFTKYVPFTEQ